MKRIPFIVTAVIFVSSIANDLHAQTDQINVVTTAVPFENFSQRKGRWHG